jgi:hypothetical protein
MYASLHEKVSSYLSVLRNTNRLGKVKGLSSLREFAHIYKHTPIYKYIFKKIDR